MGVTIHGRRLVPSSRRDVLIPPVSLTTVHLLWKGGTMDIATIILAANIVLAYARFGYEIWKDIHNNKTQK